MAKKININLQNLPPAARIAIALVPTVLIIVLFFFLSYKPKAAEIKKFKADIISQEKEIAKNEAKVAKLSEIKEKYKELEFSLKLLSQQLPEEKEVSDLLKQISDHGVKSGLSIKLWKPGSKQVHPSNIVYVIPVSVKMSGTYHNLGTFFSRLTGLSRIVNTEDITMKKTSSQKEGRLAAIDISFKTQTFSAIPLKEMQDLQGKKSKKRRR